MRDLAEARAFWGGTIGYPETRSAADRADLGQLFAGDRPAWASDG